MIEKRVCPVCGERYINVGAHAERCRGPLPPVESDPGDEQADA